MEHVLSDFHLEQLRSLVSHLSKLILSLGLVPATTSEEVIELTTVWNWHPLSTDNMASFPFVNSDVLHAVRIRSARLEKVVSLFIKDLNVPDSHSELEWWIRKPFLFQLREKVICHQAYYSGVGSTAIHCVFFATSCCAVHEYRDVDSFNESSDVGRQWLVEDESGRCFLGVRFWNIYFFSDPVLSVDQSDSVAVDLDILLLETVVWLHSDNALDWHALNKGVEFAGATATNHSHSFLRAFPEALIHCSVHYLNC